MGIRGDSALVPWRPFFWNDAEVVVAITGNPLVKLGARGLAPGFLLKK